MNMLYVFLISTPPDGIGDDFVPPGPRANVITSFVMRKKMVDGRSILPRLSRLIKSVAAFGVFPHF